MRIAAAALGLLLIAGSQDAPPLVQIDEARSPDAATQAAFRAAFGRASPAPVQRDGRTFDFEPLLAVELGDGRLALLSTGVLRDAGHADTGLNAIHYLVRRDGRLRLVDGWFGLGAEGSHGRAAGRWGVSRAISRWPVLYTEGGGTFQGCTITSATLIELRPAGPVDVADFPVHFDDAGMIEAPRARQVEGAIVAAVPDRSFTLRYGGSLRFSETYRRQGDRYQLSGRGETRMPGC